MNLRLYQPPASHYLTGGYLYNEKLAQNSVFQLRTINIQGLITTLSEAFRQEWVILDSLFLYETELLPYLEGRPLLWLVHDLRSCDPTRSFQERQHLRHQERRFLEKANGIMATSRFMADYLGTEFGLANVGFAEPGQDVSTLRKYQELRKTHRVREGRPVEILSVGHMIPRKGYVEAVKVLHQMVRAYDCHDWRWLIIGSLDHDREYVAKFRELTTTFKLESQIEFLGLCPQSQVWDLMAKVELLWLPSRFEAFGMVVTEAIGIGLPVLAPNIGELPNLISSKHRGYLYDPGDVKQLGDFLSRVIKNAGFRSCENPEESTKGGSLRSWEDTKKSWEDFCQSLHLKLQ